MSFKQHDHIVVDTSSYHGNNSQFGNFYRGGSSSQFYKHGNSFSSASLDYNDSLDDMSISSQSWNISNQSSIKELEYGLFDGDDYKPFFSPSFIDNVTTDENSLGNGDTSRSFPNPLSQPDDNSYPSDMTTVYTPTPFSDDDSSQAGSIALPPESIYSQSETDQIPEQEVIPKVSDPMPSDSTDDSASDSPDDNPKQKESSIPRKNKKRGGKRHRGKRFSVFEKRMIMKLYRDFHKQNPKRQIKEIAVDIKIIMLQNSWLKSDADIATFIYNNPDKRKIRDYYLV